MTLDAWLERLRMMSRSTVVELSPAEVGDLVNAIGPRGDAAAAEREACARAVGVLKLSRALCSCKHGPCEHDASLDAAADAIRARGSGG